MRLDLYVSEQMAVSRTKAQILIKQGLVSVNGEVEKKASFEVDEKCKIEVQQFDNYVSRGAYKLLGAIDGFGLDFNNRVVLDVGASTGGFTQVCLLNGASKVYAVDVGKGELHTSLISDRRVVNLEQTDIRNLDKNVVKDVNFIVGDVSFISLTKVLPALQKLLDESVEMMFLFKPQFECGMQIAKKYRGVIKNPKVHIELLTQFVQFCSGLGLTITNITSSPIKGGDGNIEYLIHFNKGVQNFNIEDIVLKAFD